MASENTIIIDVEVQASDAAQKLAQTKQQIASLKSEQKQLNEFIKAGADQTGELSAQYAQNAAEIKQLTAQEKMYTAQLNITTEGNKAMGDSLVEMSATLARLKAEYRGMTEEQRKSAGGQELLKSIQDLDGKMKEADGTLGDFQRNVGNYASALGGSNQVVVKAAQLFAGGFRNGITQAGAALKAFGKTLLTTPVGWIVAGVTALIKVFQQLRDAFQRNDEAGTALAVAMARLKPVVTAIKEVFSALAGAVATFVGGVTKAASAIIGFLVPSFKAASQAAAEAAKAQDALEDKEREYTVSSAQRAKERAQLEDEARNNEKLTNEERMAMLTRSKELAEQDLKDRKAIAEEKFRLLQQEAKETNDTSDAMKNRLAEAQAAMLDADREFVEGTRRLNRQLRATREEMERDAQQKAQAARQRWEEIKRARQEAAKTELDELRKLEDMTLAMITDEAEREEKTANTKYSREVADLKKRLDEEKNLTAKAREAINAQIVLLEKQHTAEVEAIREKYSKEALDREIAAQREIIDARIAAMDEGQAKEEAAVNAKYAAELQDLRRRLTEEADLTVSEREALNERIKAIEAQQAREIEAIRSEAIKKTYDALALDLSNRLERAMLDAGENARLQAEAQLAYAQQAYNTLVTMDEATKAAMYDSEAQYQAAVLASEKAVYDARKANEETLQQQANEIGQTMQAVTSSLSDLFGAAAEDTEAYEKFKKAMAIVDAMISMATTIAAATTASTQGDPYTMAIRIAANVAAVTAQFAAVIKAIKAAAIPSAPAFSEGGVVPGDSWTGDKVTARLNSGEMVLTKAMQENLLRLLANGIPAATIDYARLEEAFRDAVAEMPNPVMIYSEFEQFQRNVKKIRNITKI